MKKILISLATLTVAAAAIVAMVSRSESDSLFESNVEALSAGEGVSVSVCLGIWGTCTTPDGSKSMAPLASMTF